MLFRFYMPGQMYARAVAGDFDGDGKRELAVTDTGGRAKIGHLTVWKLRSTWK